MKPKITLLAHPSVYLAIQNALFGKGIRKRDLPDAVQDVYVRALQSFEVTPPPAAQRADVVYTSDFDDLSRLRDAHFHGVRVMGV